MEGSQKTLSVLTGLAVAALGLLPVLWLLPTKEPTPEPVTEPVSPTTTVAAREEVVVVPPPVLEIDGLAPEITRVLQANGFAELVTVPDAVTQLPPAVARVLVDRGIVLTVAEPESGGAP